MTLSTFIDEHVTGSGGGYLAQHQLFEQVCLTLTTPITVGLTRVTPRTANQPLTLFEHTTQLHSAPS